MTYTNPGRKYNVYIGKIEDEIKTKDISFVEFIARLRNDHQSARNLQLVIWWSFIFYLLSSFYYEKKANHFSKRHTKHVVVFM